MTADVGALQRLPKLIPDGLARELAYTGRKLSCEEAQRIGLVNRCFETPETLLAGVFDIARDIAQKSLLGIRATKEMMLYIRDRRVADGLSSIATWNAGLLMSSDLQEALAANLEKRSPRFSG